MTESILQVIADNPALLGAVKKVILDEFDLTAINETMDDEVLGQKLRARLVGIQNINRAFMKIEQYKTAPKVEDKINPAR